jgi:hypothetical protein
MLIISICKCPTIINQTINFCGDLLAAIREEPKDIETILDIIAV